MVEGRNKIKFLSGQLVKGLPSLNYVDLNANGCIDEEFWGPTSIAELPEIINENCGYRNQTAKKKLFDQSCGIVLVEERAHIGAIGGVQSKKGKWPFLVALRTSAAPKQFFCGASLITTKHVLTGTFATLLL